MQDAAHSSWSSMIDRCTNPKCPAYVYYGERGITVCDRWLKSFAAFREDMGPRPFKMSLGRIDNDGNYEPSNCRWETAKQQAANRRPHGSVLRKLGPRKPNRVPTEFGGPTFCRVPSCHARIYLKKSSPNGWRFGGDGKEPVLAHWVAICPYHSTKPFPEKLTKEGWDRLVASGRIDSQEAGS